MVSPAKEQQYVIDNLKEISKDARNITLVGGHGVGKTWIAREIRDSDLKKNLVSTSLWLSLNRNYNVEQDIAWQLSVFSTAEQELQDEETSNQDKKKELESKPEVYLREKIRARLEKIMPKKDGEWEPMLLILDGIPNKMTYKEQQKEIISKVTELLPQRNKDLLKVLATKTVTKAEYIVDYLKEDQADTIEFVDNRPGEEKTGLVKEIKELLNKNKSTEKNEVSKKCLLYKPLQVNVSTRSDEKYIHGEIARQLNIDREVGDGIEEEGQKESLMEKIRAKLREMATSNVGRKEGILLILEDAPNGTKFEELSKILKEEKLLKVIVTRSNMKNAFILQRNEEVIEIENQESLDVLLELIKKKSLSNRVMEKFEKIFSNKFPAAIIFMIEKAVNGIGDHDSRVSTLENILLEAADIEEDEKKIKSLVQCVYDMLPSEEVAMIKCFWHCRELFDKHESIHYNELITYWIMEGYFDPVDHIEKAYKKGHRVLMEFHKRGILKLQEDEFVSMEKLAMIVPDRRRNGISGAARLGLTLLNKEQMQFDLGRITLADGMIKSICYSKKWEHFTTLVMDGSRLHREVPKNFFKPMKALKILVLLKPRLKSLEFLESLEQQGSTSSKLRILVVRGCEMLEKIDHLKKLESLEVLEISGARNLMDIPNDVFAKLTKLQSLNLSGLPIKSLSPSFSKLTALRWLILRHCTNLIELPKLKTFRNLEVLDLFGARSFKSFNDGELENLEKLKMVDLSQTSIQILPVMNNSRALTQLSLRDCESFTSLRTLKGSSSLQIIDLSGATSLKELRKEFLDGKTKLRIIDLSRSKISIPSNLLRLSSLEVLDLSHMCFDQKPGKQGFENEIDKISFDDLKCLRRLNMSNTKVKKLPSLSGLSNLHDLLLMDCQLLEELPEMEGLNRLEVLNLSGACLLGSIPDLNSGNLSCLRRLNLSKTKVRVLPSLSYLGSLCELLLSDCTTLKELPDMKGLKRLEKLDLSGATSLEQIPDGSFDQMSNLHQLLLSNCVNLCKLPSLSASKKLEVIDLSGCSALSEIKDKTFEHIASLEQLKLSESKIEDLPALSNLKKLSQLLLRNCSNLKKLPSLESLSNLEELDLSRVKFLQENEAKWLEKMAKLCKLSLGNCSSLNYKLPSLEKLIHLETLDLQGIAANEFPYWISKLIHLKSLHLPDLKQIQQLDWGRIKRLPVVQNWDECGIFTNPDIHFRGSSPPFMSVSGTELFKFLNKDSKIWEKCFKDESHISVHSSTFSRNDEYIYCLVDEFRDIHFSTLSCPKTDGVSMEIRGFDREFPSGIEEILKQAIYIFLTENKFITTLSDIGGKDSTASMKGLWLDSCSKMESIFCENEDIKLHQSLEILWVSNLVSLRSLCRGRVRDESFKNLKHLYINCCPNLEIVFTHQQLPDNLEILEIKFCDRLKTLFEPSSEKRELKKLRELNLVELPELSRIGIRLPSLKNVKARNCPTLEKSVDLDRENGLQERIRECFGLVDGARVEFYRLPDKDSLGMCLMGCPHQESQRNVS